MVKTLENNQGQTSNMFSPVSRSRSVVCILSMALLALLLQGCPASVQYHSAPNIRAGAYVDLFNFSDRAIHPAAIDEIYLEVARLMHITPSRFKPRPRVLVVSPAHIYREDFRLRPSTKRLNGIAVALYIPQEDKILIPDFDRALLTHEMVHYFAFRYLSVPRPKWEEMADAILSESATR